MNITLHNFLMRLGSPLAHAIFLGLAIALMSINSWAQTPPVTAPLQLIVIDNPGCPACQAFNRDIGQERFDASPESTRATLSYVVAGQTPPEWFVTAYNGTRIKQIQYTPTFLIMAPSSDGKGMREVARFVGYQNPEWWFGKLRDVLDLVEPHMEDNIFQEGDGEPIWYDRSLSEIQAFELKRSV